MINVINGILAGFIIGSYFGKRKAARTIYTCLKESLAKGETLKDFVDSIEKDDNEEEGKVKNG